LKTKEAESDPWTQVHIDLVGPWPVQTASGTRYLSALTCINPATGWFVMVEIPDKTTESIMEVLNKFGYADILVLKWYDSIMEMNSKQDSCKCAGTIV
jgi:hypothetical protein